MTPNRKDLLGQLGTPQQNEQGTTHENTFVSDLSSLSVDVEAPAGTQFSVKLSIFGAHIEKMSRRRYIGLDYAACHCWVSIEMMKARIGSQGLKKTNEESLASLWKQLLSTTWTNNTVRGVCGSSCDYIYVYERNKREARLSQLLLPFLYFFSRIVISSLRTSFVFKSLCALQLSLLKEARIFNFSHFSTSPQTPFYSIFALVFTSFI